MPSTPEHTIVVLVFVPDNGQILLVRQTYGNRYWSLPGGVVEHGESLIEAAIREVSEETGLDIDVKRVIGLYSKPGENALAITLEADLLGGELRPNNEISEARYFPPDQLPKNIRAHLVQRVTDYQQSSSGCALRTQ